MSSNPRPNSEFAPAPLNLPEPQAQPTAAHPQPESASPSMDRRILLGLAGVAGVAALANFAKAGQLSPPAGPITPTGVSLTEIDAKTSEAKLTLNAIEKKVARSEQGISEPRTPLSACEQPPGSDCLYRITVPGAYYMTENVQQVPGLSCCVSIECDDVDIDGQGFSFVGSGNAASPPAPCVRAVGRSDIELYDCAFRSWRGGPIDCDDSDRCYFSDISFRHCTCPPGFHSDGSFSPGAMIRCRDGCEIDDVAISSCDGGAVVVRDSSTVCDVRWTSCTGQVCVCRDACCIEQLEIVSCAGGGGGAGGMLLARDGVIHRDIAVRLCTCPQGLFVAGAKWVCEDSCLTGNTGPHLICGRDACINKIQIGGEGTAIVCGVGSCVEAVSFHNHLGDCIVAADNCAVCDIECRSCTGVAITCGAGACVEECAISAHTGDCVRCADGSCVTEVECRSCVGVCISVGQSSLIEDCDASGGGGGGSFRCLDGSSVRRSRSHSRDATMDIAVADNCSVEDCTVIRGQGIRCAAGCCISDNRLSACTGGPDTTAGMGGAILVMGPHCSVEENQLTDCRIAISVQGGAHFCSVDDNHVSASIGGITGGVVAGIVVAAAASRVMCTCNHLRVPQGAEAFVAGSSSFGPLVSLQPFGGDISATAPTGSHHLANFIVS